jgi:uncharacterized protein (TIGR03083 family)
MNDQALWAAIDLQRSRTADLLDDLSTEEWDHASLCEGWTVRDVAAHLTLQQLTLPDALALFLGSPGGINHVIHTSSTRKARQPKEQLIAEIRGMIGSHRSNVGVTPQETLIDIVVHGQDIAVPLGRRLDVPPDAAAAAASRVWAGQASRKGRRMARVFRPLPYASYRFSATDTDWSVGDGPEVRGPILGILLLLTGRTAATSQLQGPGSTALLADLARAGA